MYIDITVKMSDECRDISIDNKQIVNALWTNLWGGQQTDMPKFYRSQKNAKIISAYKTFEEQEIYSGDILTAI